MTDRAPESRRESPTPILRFAPSPTGRLHLGHALSALLNAEMARRLGGRLLIRIEDTDLTRCRPEYTAAILDDLEWLGIRSDGPILIQSEQLPVYERAIEKLAELGLLYPCFATRQEIQAAADPLATDPDGAPVYPGLHRGMPASEFERRKLAEPFALRLDMARAVAVAAGMLNADTLTYAEFGDDQSVRRVLCDPLRWGDVVIRRKETSASYHLAVVVDDARQFVSHVVRGADLRAATDIHRLLQLLLGLPSPLYHHHRLLLDVAGRKLSKRDHATSLASLRAQGYTPDDIRRMVGIPGHT